MVSWISPPLAYIAGRVAGEKKLNSVMLPFVWFFFIYTHFYYRGSLDLQIPLSLVSSYTCPILVLLLDYFGLYIYIPFFFSLSFCTLWMTVTWFG